MARWRVGHVKGLEPGYQQTFKFLPGFLQGLGFVGNFTYVDSKRVAQSALNATEPNVSVFLISTVDTSKLPLEGLLNCAFNLAPFYQYRGLEIGLA